MKQAAKIIVSITLGAVVGFLAACSAVASMQDRPWD